MSKQSFSIFAVALTFIAFYPYIYSTLQGRIQPHVFSWIIWGIATLVVFGAQLSDNAGVGAWAIGLSGGIALVIALLAYMNQGDMRVTNSDWLFLIGALSALPFWYLTSDPLWAVLILTTVDLLGFAPTLKKVHRDPSSESLLFFALLTLRNLFVILALEHYSVTTVLFPAVVSIACVMLILTAHYRRRVLKQMPNHSL